MVLILCDCFRNLQGRAGLREGCKLHGESRNLDETIAVYMCSWQELARCNLQVVLLLMTALHVNARWTIENPISSMVSPLSHIQHQSAAWHVFEYMPAKIAEHPRLSAFLRDRLHWVV